MPEKPFPHYRKACFTHTDEPFEIILYSKQLIINVLYLHIKNCVYGDKPASASIHANLSDFTL